MMRILKCWVYVGLLMTSTVPTMAQAVGDYQTDQTGQWSNPTTWEVFFGGAWQKCENLAAGPYRNVTPTSVSGAIEIRNNTTVTASVTVDQVTHSAGTLTINASQTFTVLDNASAGDDYTNTGGTITVNGSFVVSSDAVYNHARNGGAIPLISWGSNSTCLVTGILNTSPALNAAANYQFFTWNCPGQSATITLAGNLRSVARDLMITETNDQQLRFATNQAYTLSIGGDFTIDNTSRIAFCTTGTPVVINTTGNFTYNSSAAGGSLLKTSGPYVLTVNDFTQTAGLITMGTGGGVGTINVKGAFDQSGGTINETGAGSGLFVFNGNSGIQSVSSAGTITGTIDFQVNNVSVSGGIQLLSDLSIGGALTQTAGSIELNSQTLTINGNFTQASGAIVTDPSAQLILQGTGTLPAGAVTFSGTDLLTLTVNQTGTLTTASALTITNLNLFNGTISSGSITMAADGLIQRNAGSISATPSGTSYDLTYINAGAINSGPEMPASATLLRHLTKQGAGTLTLNQALVTVNGDFTTTTGTFACGANSMSIAGNFNSNAAFTTAAGSTVTFTGPGSFIQGSVASAFRNITVNGDLTPNVNYTVAGNYAVGAAGVVHAGTGLVTFNGTTTVTIASGGVMNLGAVTIAAAATLNAPAGTMGIAGNLLINNTSVFNNGGGTIAFNGTTVLSGAGTKTFNNVNVTGAISAAGTVAWGINGALTNSGSVNFSGSTGNTSFGGTTPSLSGAGTTQFGPVVVLGGATLTTSAVFSMTTLNINATGVLTANADFSLTGNFTGTGNFSSTATVTFAGGTTSMTAAGTKSFKDIVVNNGAVFSPAVSCTVSGNINFLGTGNMADPNNTHTFTFTGTPSTVDGVGTGNILFDGITVNGGASLQLNRNITIDNTFTATGNVTAANGVAVTFTGLSMSGAGTISLHDVVVGTGNFTPNANYSIGGNLTVNGTLLAGNSTTTFTGTGSISGAGGTTFNFLTIASGANITSSAGTISVVRDFRNDGTFNHNNGTVSFSTAGTVQQQILGNASTTFYNLNISNVGVATDVTNAVASPQSVTIMGTLNFNEANAVIDADGAGSSIFIIGSTSDNPVNDGRIASLAQFAGNNVTGSVTVRRYMSFEGGSNSPNYDNGRIYRYLSSPVQNAPISQWQDDFYVTGSFSGADNGTTPGCTGCTTNPSVFYYDSSIPNYVAFPGGNILTGVGYAAFIRNNLAPPGGGTPNQPITVDVTGPINSGPITINNISPVSANWNLVGNPYPSPIAWNNAGAGTTNIAAGIAIRDNGVATAGGVLVPLTVGQKIPAGQAFWVRANVNGAATLVINESDKTTVDASTIFYRSGTASQDQLSVKVVRNDGKYDESFVTINPQAVQSLDQFDIPKKNDVNDLNNDFIDITTVSSDGKSLMQNSMNQLDCSQQLNLKFYDQLVTGGTPLSSASFSISITPTGAFSAVQWTLHDAYLGTTNDFSVNPTYNFTITGSIPASAATDRFKLTASSGSIDTGLSIAAASSSCAGSDAQITVGSSQNAVMYGVEVNGTLYPNLVQGTGGDISLVVDDTWLLAGSNTIRVQANSGCQSAAIGSPVQIEVAPVYAAAATSPPAQCSSGTFSFTATGAPGNGSYRWYDSPVSSTVLATGSSFSTMVPATRSYFVAAVNAAGCEGLRAEVVATIADTTAVNLDIVQSAAAVCKGSEMKFTATSSDGQGQFLWYDSPDPAATPLATLNSGVDFTRTLTSNKDYYVRYSPASGCITQARVVHGATYTFNYTLTTGPATTVCEGQQHKLTVSGAPSGSVYNWYSADGTQLLGSGSEFETLPLVKDQAFLVSAADETGCSTAKVPYPLQVIAMPGTPSITASTGSSSLCQDTEAEVTITNPAAGLTYRWYESPTALTPIHEGSVLPSRSYSVNQSFYVGAVNSLGCETVAASRKKVDVHVISFDEPVIESPLYGVLKSSYTQGNQWFVNGEPLSGQVDQTLRVFDPGYYTVQVDYQGCIASSNVIFTTDLITGLEDQSRIIRLYPNPVSDKLTVHALGNDPVTGQLLDVQGRQIATIQMLPGDGEWAGELDVRPIAKGFYLLRLSSGERSVTHKVIIR